MTRRFRFPTHLPRLRMLAVAVALLAVALTLAVASVLSLWMEAAANRRDLFDIRDRDGRLAGQVTSLENQLRGLGEVPITQTAPPPSPPPVVPRTTTTATIPEPARRTDAPPPSGTTTTIGTTTSTTTTSTTLGVCLGGIGVGCILPNGKVHPRGNVAAVVRSATTNIGRNP